MTMDVSVQHKECFFQSPAFSAVLEEKCSKCSIGKSPLSYSYKASFIQAPLQSLTLQPQLLKKVPSSMVHLGPQQDSLDLEKRPYMSFIWHQTRKRDTVYMTESFKGQPVSFQWLNDFVVQKFKQYRTQSIHFPNALGVTQSTVQDVLQARK